MPTKFEIFMQHASDDFDRDSPHGPTDYDDFLTHFRDFDWQNETNRSFWARKGSPGIGVRNRETNAMLWVVSYDVLSQALKYREPTNEGWIDFIVGLNNAPEPTGEYSAEDLERLNYWRFSSPNAPDVEEAFAFYFEWDFDGLYEHFLTLMPVSLVD